MLIEIFEYPEPLNSGLDGIFNNLTPYFHGLRNVSQFSLKAFRTRTVAVLSFFSNIFLILHSEKYSKTASVNNRKLSRVD